MKKIIFKSIWVILSFTLTHLCSAIESDVDMTKVEPTEVEKATNLIRYGQQLREDTIWAYSEESTKADSNQRIVFTLENDIFNFQGYEEIERKHRNSFYFDSIIEKGRPIRIINKDQMDKKSVQNLFCEAWSEAAMHAPYYRKLREEAFSILHQQGDWDVAATYSKKPTEESFQEGCRLIIEEEAHQQALVKFIESAKQRNVIALYMIGMLYVKNKLHNSYLEINISDKKYYFEVGFSWLYLAAFHQYGPALKFIYREQKNFLPSLDILF